MLDSSSWPRDLLTRFQEVTSAQILQIFHFLKRLSLSLKELIYINKRSKIEITKKIIKKKQF